MVQRFVFPLASKRLLRSYSSRKRSKFSILTNLVTNISESGEKSGTPHHFLLSRYNTTNSIKTDDKDTKEVDEWQNPNVEKWDQRIELNEFKDDEEPEIAPLPPFDDESGKVIASEQIHELAESIINMKLKDVVQLSRLIKEHFNIEEGDYDDDDSGGGGTDGGGAEEVTAQEEKTHFELKLTGFDAKSKIKVIKEVRAITGLGLKDAKEIVENAPKVIKKDVKKEEADELKEKLEAVGATVELE